MKVKDLIVFLQSLENQDSLVKVVEFNKEYDEHGDWSYSSAGNGYLQTLTTDYISSELYEDGYSIVLGSFS